MTVDQVDSEMERWAHTFTDFNILRMHDQPHIDTKKELKDPGLREFRRLLMKNAFKADFK